MLCCSAWHTSYSSVVCFICCFYKFLCLLKHLYGYQWFMFAVADNYVTIFFLTSCSRSIIPTNLTDIKWILQNVVDNSPFKFIASGGSIASFIQHESNIRNAFMLIYILVKNHLNNLSLFRHDDRNFVFVHFIAIRDFAIVSTR